MSQGLISRSPDLKRLQDEGYAIEIREGHLLIHRVPYVDTTRTVQFGTLVSTLQLAGDRTSRPDQHVAMFAGAAPCNQHGQVLHSILNSSSRRDLGSGIQIDHTFSSKPIGGYPDYYEKMTTYVNILAGPAQAIDSDATARTFPVIEATEEDSVFRYLDTASSRAGIGAISEKLERDKIAIVGLGGTGAYILDLVAKTPVDEIHVFDGDKFHQHNAFRSPGAPSINQLGEAPSKVAYFHELYSRMRRNIIPHNHYLDGSNVEILREMDFVFIAIDDGNAKREIVEALEEYGLSFIDVGMGVYESEGSLAGTLRVTASTPTQRHHVRARNRIPFSNDDGENEYSQNIQIADLNALNATLAVLKWKKLWGFYRDLEDEHFSAYDIDGNHLLNEDQG